MTDYRQLVETDGFWQTRLSRERKENLQEDSNKTLIEKVIRLEEEAILANQKVNRCEDILNTLSLRAYKCTHENCGNVVVLMGGSSSDIEGSVSCCNGRVFETLVSEVERPGHLSNAGFFEELFVDKRTTKEELFNAARGFSGAPPALINRGETSPRLCESDRPSVGGLFGSGQDPSRASQPNPGVTLFGGNRPSNGFGFGAKAVSSSADRINPGTTANSRFKSGRSKDSGLFGAAPSSFGSYRPAFGSFGGIDSSSRTGQTNHHASGSPISLSVRFEEE